MNGLFPLTLLVFSRPEPAGECIRSSSSAESFFRPQILQATSARPPMRAAPPTPTTTPMIIRFCDSSNPEFPELLLPPLRLGSLVAVELLVTARRALVVRTWEYVLPLLIVTTVVTTFCVLLDTGGVVVEKTTERVALDVESEDDEIEVDDDATRNDEVDEGVEREEVVARVISCVDDGNIVLVGAVELDDRSLDVNVGVDDVDDVVADEVVAEEVDVDDVAAADEELGAVDDPPDVAVGEVESLEEAADPAGDTALFCRPLRTASSTPPADTMDRIAKTT